MTIHTALISLCVLIAMPSRAVAQLVPAPVERQPSVCPDRPADPPLIQNMDFREAYLSLFIKDIYKAYAYNEIVETRTCDCDQRFPPWDTVVGYYLENYAGIDDRNEVRERNRIYEDSYRQNRSAVRDICMTVGNW